MIVKLNDVKPKRRGVINPIKMAIDLSTFDILTRYIVASPSFVRINHVTNLNKLISGLDMELYVNDPEKMKRIMFIRRGIEARLSYNLTDIKLVINHICSGLDFDVDFINFDNCYLTTDEIKWCHEMVSTSIQYSFVYDYTDKLLDICTRIQTTDYSRRGAIIKEFESIIDDLKNQFRKSRTEDNLTDMTFSLRDGKFEEAITDTWNLVTNPSRRLICGMQGLNEMIGGGFESGRVYMLMGITGVGKSISLLNLVWQLKKWNKHYKPKDPAKTPAIVLLTMENTVVETITRLFDLVTESSGGMGMGNFSVDKVIEMLRTEGQLSLNDDSPIDIIIKYKANKSVDTSYLYTLCDDLEDDGYEIIALVQDHVKRIRSIFNSNELRIELGDIVNEFKVFAANKDIPVLTNTHLNRDAARILEEASNKHTKTDITMKLGKSNVGESLLMLDNIDCSIIINIDFDEDGNKYMVYNLSKMRDKTNRTYIAQPFVYGSNIRMLEDMGGVPVFKESLHRNESVPRIASIRTSSANVMMDIDDIITKNAFSRVPNVDLTDDGEGNGFFDLLGRKPPEPEPVIVVEEVKESKTDDKINHPKVVCPIFFFDNPVVKPSLDDIVSLKEELQKSS